MTNIENSQFKDNNAKNAGVFYRKNGHSTIEDSTFANNNVTGNSGVLELISGTTNITTSSFTQNTAAENGGVITKVNGTLQIKSSNFTQNVAKNAGALYTEGGFFNITKSIFTQNTATMDYGVIFNNYSSLVTIKDSQFSQNTAKRNYGVYYHYFSQSLIENSKFDLNTAGNNTGVLYIERGILNVINSEFSNNNASSTGAIYLNQLSSNIIKSKFLNNNAKEDAGTIYKKEGTLVITDSQFNNNFAKNGGVIYNDVGITNITNSIFNNNRATNDGGVIYKKSGTMNIVNSDFNFNTAKNAGVINSLKGLLNVTKSNFNTNTANNASTIFNGQAAYVRNSVFTKCTPINFYLNDEYRIAIKNSDNYIPDRGNVTVNVNGQDVPGRYTMINGEVTDYAPVNGTYKITVSGTNTERFENNVYFLDVSYTKQDVKVTVNPLKGVIGEDIELKASVKTLNGMQANGGNIIFKLNGKTLRSDGRFDSNASPWKFSVRGNDIIVKIKADLYLRNAKNLSASYSGNYKYNEAKSNTQIAQIQKRYASLNLTLKPSYIRHYEYLQIIAKVADITKNSKNYTLITKDTRVMFKINGVTLKDSNNKIIYVPVAGDRTAVHVYTILAGTGGITNTKAIRDYKVDAIFMGDNYYPTARNTSTFNVERSITNVRMGQVTVSKTNVLNIKANLTDYRNNNLVGTNKVTIKVNGKSYTKNGKPVYWAVKNGVVNLSGLKVDPGITVKRVMIVTGERQAYLEGRGETTNIIRV